MEIYLDKVLSLITLRNYPVLLVIKDAEWKVLSLNYEEFYQWLRTEDSPIRKEFYINFTYLNLFFQQ